MLATVLDPGTRDPRAVFVDSSAGTVTRLDSHGDELIGLAIDRAGSTVATVDDEGVIRVGRPDGSEPHLLFGGGRPGFLAFDPAGRWLVSKGDGWHFWPLPDIDAPPLHTLPRAELLEKLRALTNLRNVPDAESPNGWGVHWEAFPGWDHDPIWW